MADLGRRGGQSERISVSRSLMIFNTSVLSPFDAASTEMLI